MASIFRLKADVYFEADDLDDAFDKLIDHFSYLEDTDSGYPAIEFLANSEMELHPEDPPTITFIESLTTTTSG